MRTFAVIMAGGSGTRFWPLSRRARPKQFLALDGTEPLIVATARRLRPLVGTAETLVACGPDHAATVRLLLPELPRSNVIVEPCARNTAPCVGLAALHVRARAPEGIMAVLPADHHVTRPAAFRRTLATAVRLAAHGHVVTIGIRPIRPETGYGYLEVGRRLPGTGDRAAAPRRVKRFVEKPDAPTAVRFVEGGRHLWNSGIFVFRADIILQEIGRAMPALAAQLDEMGRTMGTRTERRTLARLFPTCPSESIDRGVMETSRRIVVVPAGFGWSDVGSFASLNEIRRADASGNVTEGAALIINGRDNVVLGRRDRPLTVVGLDGIVAVDGGDAILIVHRDRTQDVRRAVEELRRRGGERWL